jgi:tetratricopeptide (TPR) repeat protein
VSGIYTDTTSICKALKQATQAYDRNSISISFAEKTDTIANQHLDTLESSFMYTQLLKEILLTVDFEKIHFDDFIRYSREQCAGDNVNLEKVDKIEKEYRQHQPIWWYTSEPIVYSMLNRALRKMEADLIVNMGFFVRDLHEHIAKLHSEQSSGHHRPNSSIVYRGQGLSKVHFNQLCSREGGLLAFNNFLSTSANQGICRLFAESNATHPDLVGVLFEIHIDPSTSSTPFADISRITQFPEEEEILFSMHSVFRIGRVRPIEENNNHIWQVELTLTVDHDPQLKEVMDIMREEIDESTEWFRLAKLMMKVAQFDKAQQLFELILARATNEKERAEIYHYLAWNKYDQGINTGAIAYYEKSIEIKQKTLPVNRPDLANSYNNIGLVYHNMGEYSKAVLCLEKALEIEEKTLPANRPSLATSYNNIGLVYYNMGEYSKALSYYEKALEIDQKTLPANHPHLATSYNNIGSVYDNMGEYSKALSYYEKALEIDQKTLPANHPHLATSYNNIGSVYDNMGEYSKALSYLERALDIFQRSLPPDHPNIKTVETSIETVRKSCE